MATKYELVGDTQPVAEKSAVTVLDLPIVAQADLEDKDNVINDRLLSGKKLGGMVLVKETTGTGYDLAVATGPAETDTWELIGDDTTEVITPA